MNSRTKKAKLTPYKCAICHKAFPSPEAGAAHLDKKHNGHGYLSWFQPTQRYA